MKRIVYLFIVAIVATVFLASPVSADEIACGELEGIAFQDGYIPTPDSEISIPHFYASSTGSAETLDDYKDEILKEWDSYSGSTIDISTLNLTTSKTDLTRLQVFYSSLINDNPQYFYVDSRLSYYYNTNTGVLTAIKPKYNFNPSEIPGLINSLNSATEKAMSSINDSMSDIDKMIALHDHIVLNAEYDLETYETHNNDHPTSFSAYGVLVKGIGVCQSYTLAYSLLLKLADIEVSTVSSTALSHIWNLVKIDGEWYHVDVTWDDPTFDKKGLVSYRYFLASDEEFGARSATHYASDWVKYYTAESDKYKNAFWKNAFSPLALLDGYYYYTNDNGSDIALVRSSLSSIEGSEHIRSLSDMYWMYQGGYVSGGQFRAVPFVFDGDIYYNTTDSIYRLCPGFNSDELVFTANITDGFIVPIKVNAVDCTLSYLNVTYSNNNYYYSASGEADLRGGHNYITTIISPKDTEYGYTEAICSTCSHIHKYDYTKPLKYLPGDSDGDGQITSLDAILAVRVISNWSYAIDSSLDFNIDIDGDEKLTSIDVTILMRHLAGWIGYETLPNN